VLSIEAENRNRIFQKSNQKTKSSLKVMKTKQISTLIAGFILIAGLSSCMDEIFLSGNGDVQSQNRQISGFDAVSSSGDYHVSIMPGTEFSVQVKAESNLLPYIETELHGTTLNIGTIGLHTIRHHDPIEVFITQPQLTGLNLSGSGFIKTGSFNCDNLQIGISGSGDINAQVIAKTITAILSGSGNIILSGNADSSNYRISGSGKIKTYDLIQNHCQSSISGSGDVYANVVKTLQASISGSGSVYYLGNPSVQANISGSGKVMAKNQ
jgi:hypothetical protein